jgi:hypothetical protein
MGQHDVTILVKARDLASGSLNTVGASLRRLAGFAMGAFSAYGAYSVVKRSINDFIEAESATRRFGDALANLGARGELPAMREFSEQLGVMSAKCEIDIQKVMALGAAMGLHGDTLKAATISAVGYSSALGIDVTTAMKSVGKAAQGNAAIFGRMGVAIDKSKSAQDQFQQVLAKGASNFKVAQGQTDTMKGGVDSLKNAIEDLRVGFGDFITQILKIPEKLHWVSFALRHMELTMRLVKENINLTVSEMIQGIDPYTGQKKGNIITNAFRGGGAIIAGLMATGGTTSNEPGRSFSDKFKAGAMGYAKNKEANDSAILDIYRGKIDKISALLAKTYESEHNPFAPDVFNKGAGIVAGGGGLAAVRQGGFTMETGTGRLGGGGQSPVETKLDRLIKLQEISNSIEERRLSQETRDSSNDFSSDLFETNFQ